MNGYLPRLAPPIGNCRYCTVTVAANWLPSRAQAFLELPPVLPIKPSTAIPPLPCLLASSLFSSFAFLSIRSRTTTSAHVATVRPNSSFSFLFPFCCANLLLIFDSCASNARQSRTITHTTFPFRLRQHCLSFIFTTYGFGPNPVGTTHCI